MRTSHLYRLGVLGPVALLTVPLFGACRDNDPGDRGETGGGGSVTVTAPRLSANEAIELTRTYAYTPGRSVTVEAPYQETVTRQVLCSPAEVERERGLPAQQRRCRPNAAGTAHHKSVREVVARCCRTRQVGLPAEGAWRAEFSEPQREWRVTVDFQFAEIPHSAVWTVDDQTREVGPL